jgi:hypothetical protein
LGATGWEEKYFGPDSEFRDVGSDIGSMFVAQNLAAGIAATPRIRFERVLFRAVAVWMRK